MSHAYLRPVIKALPDARPFVPRESIERELGRPLDLLVGANENGFGPSPKVALAITEGFERMWRYPDGETFNLRSGLARHYGLELDHFVLGNGIDGLLGNICRLCLDPDDCAVTSCGAYPTFNYHINAIGASVVAVPFDHFHEDLNALARAAQEHRPKLVYLSNPDNPMGTWHSAQAVMDFHASLPETTLLVLDEAYVEMAPEDCAPPMTWLPPNVIRLRTFSKAYALAGLRVGYGMGDPDFIRAFEKTRDHFGVGRLSQIGALAAIQDQDHVNKTVEEIVKSRALIGNYCMNLGAKPIESATNFVTVDFKIGIENSNALLQALIEQGVFIRKPMTEGLDHTIRISTAPEDQITRLFELMEPALERLR